MGSNPTGPSNLDKRIKIWYDDFVVKLNIRPVRLSVRILAFQAEERGSTPLQAKIDF